MANDAFMKLVTDTGKLILELQEKPEETRWQRFCRRCREGVDVTSAPFYGAMVGTALFVVALIGTVANFRAYAAPAHPTAKYRIDFWPTPTTHHVFFAKDAKAHGGFVSLVDENDLPYALIGGAVEVRPYRP